MEDARIHLQQPPQQPIVQQQPQDECAGEGSGAAAGTWNSLEELLLVCAINRHGTGDWSAVAGELQSRIKLRPSSFFSSEACMNKYDALNVKYGYCNGGSARDHDPPWFEDVRKRRIVVLEQAIDYYEGNIASMTNRYKRLKGADRGQKQSNPEKPVIAVVEPVKPADQIATESCIVQDGGGVKSSNLEQQDPGIALTTDGLPEASTVERVLEEPVEIKENGEGPADDKDVKEAVHDGVEKAEPVEPLNEASEVAEMDVDIDDQAQKRESGTDVDMDNRVEDLDIIVMERSHKCMRQDGDEEKLGCVDVVCMKNEAADARSEDGKSEKSDLETAGKEEIVLNVENPVFCEKSGDVLPTEGKSTEVSSPSPLLEVKGEEQDKGKVGDGTKPGVEEDDTKPDGAEFPESTVTHQRQPSMNADGNVKFSESAVDVFESKEAVKASDGNFVGSTSQNAAVTAKVPDAADSGSGMLLDAERTKACDTAPSALASEEANQPVSDPAVKLVEETGRLVVDIVGEQPTATPASQDEKESSTSAAAQHSSSTDVKPVADLREKSDESQEASPQADLVEKAETLVAGSKASTQDVGSPASINEGSGSAHEHSKDSRVDRSDVGSQADGVEDTSPTSRRSNCETGLLLKLQPLMDCLRSISSNKLATSFKTKQESQDDPHYSQIIRRYVDLNMIRARLKEGAYSGSVELFRDMLLVFTNAIVYYPRDSPEHNAAVVLRKLVREEMDKHLQAEVGVKPEKAAPRKRESKKSAAENSSGGEANKAGSKQRDTTTSTTTTSTVANTTTAARQAGTPVDNAAATVTAKSASDNSRSKSASLSPGDVPSSKGGEEEEAREGEPEVEGGKAKPLKAYGRKNRGEHKSGKGVTKEKPLDAIVKKIGRAEEAAAGSTKDKELTKDKESKEKDKDNRDNTNRENNRENKEKDGKEKEKPSKVKESGKDAKGSANTELKKVESTKASGKKGKGSGTAAAAAAVQQEDAPTAAAGPVRGARNKRSAKETQRPAAKRTKR